MALIVEDGTGLANANAYITVEFADAYFADRGNADWSALTTQDKEKAIVKASDYIDVRFATRLRGAKQFDSQSMQFPRVHVPCAPSGEVPVFVQRATAEYAVRAHAGPLAPDPTIDPSGRVVVATRKKVGPIDKEVRFSEGGVNTIITFRPYPMADALLACALYAAQGSVMRN